MALEALQEKYIPRNNDFYKNYYHYVIFFLMALIVSMIALVGIVLYQASHRPQPVFTASLKTGEKMSLTPFDEPNLLSGTILRWATKVATLSYTYDLYNYSRQLAAVQPYFTDGGYADFKNAATNTVIKNVINNQLFVYGIVSGAPVITNQGVLPDMGYVWRVQIPFLVTYQSSSATSTRSYYVVLTIARVPTNINEQGIGIDQFVMTGGGL